MTLPARREDILIQVEESVANNSTFATDWVETAGFTRAFLAGQSSAVRAEHSMDAATVDLTVGPPSGGNEEIDLPLAYVRILLDRSGSGSPPSVSIRASLRGTERQ